MTLPHVGCLNYAANHALWRIVMARMAQGDPRTIVYVERRTAEGLSKRDIIRCLKRYVAREVFDVITNPRHLRLPATRSETCASLPA